MRYLIQTILIFALAVPAAAKIIEISPSITHPGASSILSSLSPVFAGKVGQELSWDDGVTNGQKYDDSADPYATTFTAPLDCRLLTYRFFWSSGNNDNIDCLLYTDDGGGAPHTPAGSTLFNVTGNTGDTSNDWFEVDVSGEGVILNSGEIFHPGWSGTYNVGGLLLDTAVSGSYACWTTNSGWTDNSANHTHMMRVVINSDLDGPFAADRNPAAGATGVAVDADILFDIEDADVGVDSSTITVNSVVVSDNTRGGIGGIVTVDDANPHDVHVTFDPHIDFVEGSTVTVTVSPPTNRITDDLGNEMAEDSWSFVVLGVGIEAASLGTIKAEFK